METKTAPSKVDRKLIIYSPTIKKITANHIDVQRIELDENYTRIDFLYYAPSHYQNGGWVQISKHTFIRPVGSEYKLKLMKAVNIPIAPQKHFFKSNRDLLSYTLYFPALSKGCTSIDIIEREINDGTWFNFYGISVEKVRKDVLIIGN
jgi:hypothetical protein